MYSSFLDFCENSIGNCWLCFLFLCHMWPNQADIRTLNTSEVANKSLLVPTPCHELHSPPTARPVMICVSLVGLKAGSEGIKKNTLIGVRLLGNTFFFSVLFDYRSELSVSHYLINPIGLSSPIKEGFTATPACL